ncbi:MAG: DUF4886 domain-containing protein [Chloroflexi bacterium]|nr:DUF4886 domain-containing protein [Chloroflexota bacterium]
MFKFGKMVLVSLVVLMVLFMGWFVIQTILDEREIEQPTQHRLLFIGNSFTNNNALDQIVAELMSNMGAEWDDVFGKRVAPGGYRISYHLYDVENSADDPLLRQLLVSGSDTTRDWDLIVIQEQSQVLGFGELSGQTARSFDAALKLHQHLEQADATVMLMLTWGYANGDPGNESLYPDYETMQNRLASGTYDLAAKMSANGSQVLVIPAGRGFQTVYQDLLGVDRDPLAQDSIFRQLYGSDGKHPSLSGSYLTACIVTAVYTNQPVSDVNWAPTELDADLAAYLRNVTDRVVFED